MAEPNSTGHSGLKHFGFVVDASKYVSGAVTAADSLYNTAKSYAPKFITPYLAKVEDSVLAYGAPAVATASDTAEKWLKTADEQVDHVYLTASKWLSLEPLRQMHASNMAAYKAATERYFALIASSTDWAADKLSLDKNVQKAKALLHSTLQKAKEMTDPDVAVDTAFEAWTKFTSVPAVAKVLETTAPLTNRGKQTFTVIHDTLVASPAYKRSLSLGASTLQWASTTTPYRLSAHYLYPYVQSYADPALDKLTRSEYLTKAVDYWKPVAA